MSSDAELAPDVVVDHPVHQLVGRAQRDVLAVGDVLRGQHVGQECRGGGGQGNSSARPRGVSVHTRTSPDAASPCSFADSVIDLTYPRSSSAAMAPCRGSPSSVSTQPDASCRTNAAAASCCASCSG